MNRYIEKVGQIHITGNHLDITDPCYNKDVWCRMAVENMAPGTYDCYVVYSEENCGLYRYVATARIVLAGGSEMVQKQLKERLERGRSWRCVGDIGVDAGIAGFFDGEKPDFTDTEWHDFCSWMNAEDSAAKSKADGKIHGWYIRNMPQTSLDGFWTCSGYGDGGYTVHAIHSIIEKKRMTTAVEIRFL